ncbi:YgfZ/GcvT domain-containing protein [Novosphingobium mangrovi (ex Huang et al. 2023)]|uniref:Folate-binding protein n=1 Tax=Novosphingobium mangrovi (ex Huang et al. 2023) TaxID=2976432 RepID=A0ABT2I0E5_9SPHN|nr:folate-binding protein [Novosphingobium mangrovi (ex Huang et al. 2023)]MCT2398271.1 folate-binding protein [Novosphingobium mangrovi (ex Huang et al. 2023)]
MTATRLFDRALIRLSPRADSEENVADFLQGLVTADVTKQLPVWAGLLSPQGKALFDFVIWPAGDGLLIDCEASAADALLKRLSMYRLRKAIDIVRDDGLAVHWRPHVGDAAAADPRLPALGERWIAAIGPADPEETETGADAAWRVHRLALGVTEGRAELGDGETLWLECNAAELNGVSFTKGCFVGQENTARMNWRQKVNRRLIVVPLARSDEKRRRMAYPELDLAVDHLRTSDVPPDLWPAWLPAPDPS